MPEPQDIGKRIQLLVEGRDQFNFFEALVVHLQLSDVQVQNFGGVSELRPFLRLLASAPNFGSISRLGIVRDAEQNAAGAFQSVQGSLQAAGLPAPDTPGQRVDGEPAVTVLILPGDDRSGMLETLLCETFASSPESDCIEAFSSASRVHPTPPSGDQTRPAPMHGWRRDRIRTFPWDSRLRRAIGISITVLLIRFASS